MAHAHAGDGDLPHPDITVSKGSAKRSYPFQDDETLEFIPLGAGNEVGRSCCLLKFKGKTIMFDCGTHPGFRGEEGLPFFDDEKVDAAAIDLLLVTHFHVDHAAAVPYFLTQTTFKGKVYMTYPTLAICKLVWSDFIKVSGISEQPGTSLYTDADINEAIDRINVINYHEQVEVEGVNFWCYNAGHVIGACMFMVEIAGVRVLYTGDYSRLEDRHLMAAEMPTVKVDVLVVESTYGIQTHEPRKSREKQLIDAVESTLMQGGRVLLPVFAIGRAQEILLLLEEHWRNHPELHKYPVICLSGMAKRCIATYQHYISQMNKRIQNLNDARNPFEFQYIKYITSMSEFHDSRPSVVMASPGMLQSGQSRELFDRWCENRANAVVITGYCVKNTLAKELLEAQPDVHKLQNGHEVPLKIKVHYVSFSAHADFIQTSNFIDELKPSSIILVHGESNMMMQLKKQLQAKYEHSGVGVWSPNNTDTVTLTFHESKVAKVVGSVAVERPRSGATLRGLVLHNNLQLTICSMDEMEDYAGENGGLRNLIQRQLIPFSQPWDVLEFHLSRLFDSIVQVSADKDAGTKDADKATKEDKKKKKASAAGDMALRIMDAVTVRKAAPGLIELKWVSNPVHDMVADAVLSVTLQTLSNPSTSRAMAKDEAALDQTANIVRTMLAHRFGCAALAPEPNGDSAETGGGGEGDVDAAAEASVVRLEVDGHEVRVDVRDETVSCGDADTQKKVEAALKRIMSCMHPYAACSCPTA
jgi:cleavage and polyadenylation specificity factor subunit 3